MTVGTGTSEHGAATWRELFVAVFASGVSVVGTSFALYGTSQAFLIISTSRIVLDVLPGSVVASIIWNFGDYSLAVSLVIFGVFLAVLTGLLSYLGYLLGSRALEARPIVSGSVGSFVAIGTAAYLVGDSLLSVLGPTLAGALAMAVLLERERLPGGRSATDETRRTLLKTLGLVGGYNVVTHAAGLLRGYGQAVPELQIDQGERENAATKLDEARQNSFDVAGLPKLAVETDNFYTVDINPRPPVIETDDWSLTITGEVANERTFDYEAIQQRETVHEVKTIRCLGDPIDGGQIGTALWTGTPLLDLVDETDPRGSHLVLRAADGYYYSMPMEMAEHGLLAFGMNNEPLPRAHGFPVRATIRNRWGKLNVKWLEEIEVVDDFESGYWEERGWDGMETVHTVVKIQTSNRLSNGAVQLAGHAYAGTTGIDAVEISTDGGQSWSEATLAPPLSDPDTWRQWKYQWQPEESTYNVVARAVDGDGTVQTRVRSDPYPAGATGWTKLQLDIDL